jgi:hypothetical protein
MIHAFLFLEQIDTKENGYESSNLQQQMPYQNGAEIEPKKVPLKFLMDPRHVQDMNSMRNQYGYDNNAPQSPEFGYELVNALNAPQGKGENSCNFFQQLIFIQEQFQALNCSPSAGRRLKSGSLKELLLNNSQQLQHHRQ